MHIEATAQAKTRYAIVLEDDAAPPLARDPAEVAARLADTINAGVAAGAHLIYLGHCGRRYKDEAVRDPDLAGFLCTHAYAITAAGAAGRRR